MTLLFSYPAVPPALLAAALLAAGCSAGSHAGDPVPRNEVETARRAAARDGAAAGGSEESREVETRLLLSEEGRLLVNAIRVHGGWDAWRAAARVSYGLLTRTLPAGGPALPAPAGAAEASGPPAVRDAVRAPAAEAGASPPPEATPAAVSVPIECPIDSAVPVGSLPGECFLFGLAFRLADPGLRLEYLGVELDAATNDYFEKLKVSRGEAEGDEWLIVFLNRSSWLLERVLTRGAGGKFTLVAFSHWVDAAGLRVATERRVWALQSPYAHWTRGVPDRVERLEDLTVTVREAPPPGRGEE